MVQKVLPDEEKNLKAKKTALYGSIDLESVRKNINPPLRVNAQSLLLFFLSFIFFAFSLPNYSIEEIKWFFLFVTFDFFLSGLVLLPFKYYEGGIDIAKTNDYSALLYNSHIERSEGKRFILLFLPRVLFYGIVSYFGLSFFSQKNFIIGTVLFLGPWIIVVFTLIIILIIGPILVGIGATIDDYMNKGTTHKALRNIRLSISKSALELDKVISSLKRINDPRLSEQNRRRIANVLYSVRNYLVIDDQNDPSYTPEMKVKFVQTEKELTKQLFNNLKNDKCVVCYTPLSNSNGPFLVCPICSHGGHKDHIEQWFTSKTVCPSCSSDVISSNFLILEEKN